MSIVVRRPTNHVAAPRLVDSAVSAATKTARSLAARCCRTHNHIKTTNVMPRQGRHKTTFDAEQRVDAQKRLKRLTGSSAFNATALVPVLDGHDEVPLLVQRDRVREQRVEDFDELEGGEEVRLERDEHVGGALADAVERGPRRGGEQLGQAGPRIGGEVRWPNVDRECVVVELRGQLSVGIDRNDNSSPKSRSSLANDPTRAAATRAGCCGAVRCVSCAKRSAASTHRKPCERRELPKRRRHRRQRVVFQLRRAVRREENNNDNSSHPRSRGL